MIQLLKKRPISSFYKTFMGQKKKKENGAGPVPQAGRPKFKKDLNFFSKFLKNFDFLNGFSSLKKGNLQKKISRRGIKQSFSKTVS